MHYQPNTHITEGVLTLGFTINNLLEFLNSQNAWRYLSKIKTPAMHVPTELAQLKSA